MTIKDLKQLPVGTLLYNGRAEGVIKDDCGVKVIETYIPIDAMSTDASDYNDRPQYWSVLEDQGKE